LTLRKSIDVSTCVAVFYILRYISLNGIYLSLKYCGVELKLCPLA